MDSGSVVFDRYQLEERIGTGGMGTVWRATDLLLDLPVALKRVCPAGGNDQHAELTRARALREARLAARLRHHRHVVATYDVRVEAGDVWLVLEYLPSQSLAQILRERGRWILDRPLESVLRSLTRWPPRTRWGSSMPCPLPGGHTSSAWAVVAPATQS